MRDGNVHTASGKFQQAIDLGPHHLTSDEPQESGGDDMGPGPHDFLLAALGACTSMTVKMYAERKGWPLDKVEVHLTQEKVDGAHSMRREIRLHGVLTDEQRARLIEIAGKCPVHKTLTGKIEIDTHLMV